MQEAEGYLELGMFSHALDTLAQLDPTGSQKAHALYLKGEAFRGQGDFAGAIDWLEQAAQAEPENFHVYMALGWCHKRCDRIDRAIQSLHRALEVADEEAIVHYNLACYYCLEIRKIETLEYLARAFELDASFRDLVADETDFESLRDDPDFQNLTSVIV